DVSRKATGAFGYFEYTLAEEIGSGDLRARAFGPEIAVIGRNDFKLDIDGVQIVLRRLGLNTRDLTDIESHEIYWIADLQPGSAIGEGEERRLGLEPAFALGGVIGVIAKTEHQQPRCQQNKPADGPFHSAQARAQLRR